MRINVAIPEAHVTPPPLNAALEATTRLNESMLAAGEVPTLDKAIKAGVRWKPEPPGDEHFDHAKTVLARKWGDCDDLAPYHCATLRHTGEDPGCEAIVKRSGPKRWHAVVRRSDGSIDDPSKAAGMGGAPIGVYGATLPLMGHQHAVVGGDVGTYMLRPQIAMRPVRGAVQARADLPWSWRERLDDKPSPTDYAMTALHTAPLASSALTGAIDGIIRLGVCAGIADPEHINRLAAIAEHAQGVPYREVRGIYGVDHAEAARQVCGTMLAPGALLGAGTTIVIPPKEAAQNALKAALNPDAPDDVRMLAQLVHKNAQGKRPDKDSLTAAVLQYLTTTMGPVVRNSADEHARLLIADQTAKRLALQPWFREQMVKASLNGDIDGLFDFVGKAMGAVGKAVGSVVRDVAPLIAKVAPFVPIVGPALSGAASFAGSMAGKLVPKARAPAPAPARAPAPAAPAARLALTSSAPRPAAGTSSASSPATASKMVPGGVPGSSAVQQGQLFHLVPFA